MQTLNIKAFTKDDAQVKAIKELPMTNARVEYTTIFYQKQSYSICNLRFQIHLQAIGWIMDTKLNHHRHTFLI